MEQLTIGVAGFNAPEKSCIAKKQPRHIREIALFEKPRIVQATLFDVWVRFEGNRYACVELLHYPIDTEALRKKSDISKLRQGKGKTWKDLGVSRNGILTIKRIINETLHKPRQVGRYIGDTICVEPAKPITIGMMGAWINTKESGIAYIILVYYPEKEFPFAVAQTIGKTWNELDLDRREIWLVKRRAAKRMAKLFEPQRQNDLFRKEGT